MRDQSLGFVLGDVPPTQVGHCVRTVCCEVGADSAGGVQSASELFRKWEPRFRIEEHFVWLGRSLDELEAKTQDLLFSNRMVISKSKSCFRDTR